MTELDEAQSVLDGLSYPGQKCLDCGKPYRDIEAAGETFYREQSGAAAIAIRCKDCGPVGSGSIANAYYVQCSSMSKCVLISHLEWLTGEKFNGSTKDCPTGYGNPRTRRSRFGR